MMDGADLPLHLPEDLSDIVLIDCDEVLLSWYSGFRRWAEKKFRLTFLAAEPAEYGLKGWIPASHAHLAMDMVQQFNASPEEGFARLEPLPGAVDLICLLNDTGHRIRIITACSLDPAIQAARISNLERVFGSDAFDDVSFVDLHGSKEAELRRHSRSLWLDDLPKHVHSGIAAGHHGMLVGASHSRTLRLEPENRDLPYVDTLEMLTPLIRSRTDAPALWQPA